MFGLRRLFGKKKSPSHDEVVESFQNSFESDNSVDMAVNVADLAIDKFIESDAVNGVPVVGLLNATYKIYKNVQAYRLAKKVYLFLYHTNEIEVEKKRKFVEEYIESNQEEGIDALLSVIDLLDNLNKVGIMANLLKAKIDGEITIYEFNRLIACLQRIPYSDIHKLNDYVEDHYEPGVTDILYTAGVLFLSHEDFENNTNEYKLNHNGNQLLKFGLKKEVQIPTEYKVKRLSVVTDSEIDSIFDDKIDEKIEEAKPKWENVGGDVLDVGTYQIAEEQAVRDIVRGK